VDPNIVSISTGMFLIVGYVARLIWLHQTLIEPSDCKSKLRLDINHF